MKNFHHFRFAKDEAGIFLQQRITVISRASACIACIVIPPASVLPQMIKPEGLSEERKRYFIYFVSIDIR